MSVRVLVADDQALVRGSFRVLVDTAADLVYVLMDIRMPGMDGIEATRQITGQLRVPGVRVLILTTFDLDEYVLAALRAGASGFRYRPAQPPTADYRPFAEKCW